MSMPPTKPTFLDCEAMAGQDADEVGAFLFLEDHRADIRLVDDHVDDGELEIRKFCRDLVQRGRPGEAGHDDRIVAVFGEAAQRLFALRGVLDFELEIVDAGFGLEFLGAVEGGLVEGFVELAAEIVDERRLDVRGEGRNGHRGRGQKAENDTFHVIHTLSVIFPMCAPAPLSPVARRHMAEVLALRSCSNLARPKRKFTRNFDLLENSRGPRCVAASEPMTETERGDGAGDAGAFQPAIAIGVLRQILLVIFLGEVEIRRRLRSRW